MEQEYPVKHWKLLQWISNRRLSVNRDINNSLQFLVDFLVNFPSNSTWFKGKQGSPLFWFTTWKPSYFLPNFLLHTICHRHTILISLQCFLESYTTCPSCSKLFGHTVMSFRNPISLDSFSQQLENIVINATCQTSLSIFLLTCSTSSIFCYI